MNLQQMTPAAAPHQNQHYFANNQYSADSAGLSSGLHYQAATAATETPKYIKNLRSELNLALKKNLELRLRIEQMEEDQEVGVQATLMEIGEQMAQKIKESGEASQIERLLSQAYEQLD